MVSQQRVGIGFDAHKFSNDDAREMWLGGIIWEGVTGLDANSDGDVISHAVADALLSAAGLPDIGAFLTPSDKFINAHADAIFAHVNRAFDEIGAEIINVSVQLIGNKPIFSKRKGESEAALSRCLQGAHVNVSATTTDFMGFTGKGEGLAAIATALITF
jgi:2-C-methyl-D-erythritol 2,4-cyclodiphosphate synthase